MRIGLVLAGMLAAGVAACSPGLPDGVSRDVLDERIAKVIGDPNTCVLIGQKAGGRVVYRYNTHAVCDRKLPACDGPGLRTTGDLLEATAKDGQPRTLSCNTVADASRGVGWASGAVPGQDLVYAASMEGDRSFPGRMMADRLTGAFERSGLSPATP